MFERRVAGQAAVDHPRQGDAAGEAERLLAGALVEVTRRVQRRVLDGQLQRGGDVSVALQHRLTRSPGSAERVVEAAGQRREALAVVEVGLVEPERALVAESHDFAELAAETRLALRRDAHDAELVVLALEAEEVGDGRLQQAEAVRHLRHAEDLDLVAAADAERRRRDLAPPVHLEDRRALVRTGEERRRHVALVVRHDVEAPVTSAAQGFHRLQVAQRRVDLVVEDVVRAELGRLEEALAVPVEHLLAQTEPRVVRDGDVVDVAHVGAGEIQARLHGAAGVAAGVLLAREPALGRRSDHAPVAHERCARVLVPQSAQAQDQHVTTPLRRAANGARRDAPRR